MHYYPNPWLITPFVVLLALIAVGPLWLPRWWSRHYPKVAFALAGVTVFYYWIVLGGEAREKVVHTAREYASFIILLSSLFVVSGGIHITVKGEATPRANVVFLAIGALVANVLGTTGASMLLIRPWLRMNKYRVTAHHVVFFIFIVSNVGGSLTPIGDPPLFLGYLRGVPFWWVARHCWPMWALGVALLLAMFFVLDYRNFMRAPKSVRATLAEPPDQWRFEGLANLFFLAVILGAVFVKQPPFLREALMVAAAVGSWFTTRKQVHESNEFTFHPIREVAVLFVGIFGTMIPALDWLQANAGNFAAPTPGVFFWGTGTLSSVLDNAPTYLSFLSAAVGASISPEVVSQIRDLALSGGAGLEIMPEGVRAAYAGLQQYFPEALMTRSVSLENAQMGYLLGNGNLNALLVAISVGAVFFGANTYIGNGPNFMVKAMAEERKVHTPGFIKYVTHFTLPFMIPMLLVIWWVFFRV